MNMVKAEMEVLPTASAGAVRWKPAVRQAQDWRKSVHRSLQKEMMWRSGGVNWSDFVLSSAQSGYQLNGDDFAIKLVTSAGEILVQDLHFLQSVKQIIIEPLPLLTGEEFIRHSVAPNNSSNPRSTTWPGHAV